jgi:uncharacterized membrane protein YkoI
MNTEILRRKRVLVPAIGTVAALAIGTTAWSASANNVTGSERDRVAEAAIKIVGGGTAEDVEHGDDASEAYEVEVRRANGTEVEVSLDKNLKEVRTEVDNDDDGDADADDRALSAKEKSSATKAALKAVSGTVTDVEASDDPGTSYEVEVRTAQGVEWDIDLDRNFAVVSKTKDD